MATKKRIADLTTAFTPVLPTTTEATPAKKKRASRSKAAIAAREAAKAYASSDWSKVSDAQVKLADTAADNEWNNATHEGKLTIATEGAAKMASDTVLSRMKEVGAGLVSREDAMAGLKADFGITSPEVDAILDTEIQTAVAALDDSNGDVEIVRSLASVGMEDDPLAEEAAAARLKRHVSKLERKLVDAVPYEFGTMIELPAGADVTFMEGTATPMLRPPLYDVIREMVDLLIASGNWVPPAGGEQEIGKYWPEIRRSMLHALSGPDASRNRLLAAQAKKLELDNAEREPPQVAIDDLASVREVVLDTYDIAVEQYDQILNLEGKLKTAETALAESMANAKSLAGIADVDRGIIQRLDAKVAELEAVAAGKQDAVTELAEKLASHGSRVTQLEGYLKTTQDLLDTEVRHNLRLNTALKSFRNRGLFARILNRAPVLPLSAPAEVYGRRNSRSTTSEVNITKRDADLKATLPLEAADQLRRQGTRVIR